MQHRISASLGILLLGLGCQPNPNRSEQKPGPSTTPPLAGGTAEAKIADALGAAPEGVTKAARVIDWPAKEGEPYPELRAGSNGWTCWPDPAAEPGRSSMCNDPNMNELLVAMYAKRAPKLTGVGIGYMLTADEEGSNTDPYARAVTTENQWHQIGPHVMMVFPDSKALTGYPTTPQLHAPYVMYVGTPYVHLMIPLH